MKLLVEVAWDHLQQQEDEGGVVTMVYYTDGTRQMSIFVNNINFRIFFQRCQQMPDESAQVNCSTSPESYCRARDTR